MIINITSTQLSSSDTALIKAAFDTANNENHATDLNAVIVFSGDGVFAQSSTVSLLAELFDLSPDSAALRYSKGLFAVAADVEIRGARVFSEVSLINHQELAELANRHQQWLTL